MPRLTREEVVALIERALGVPVARLDRDRLGASNEVHFVTLATGDECVVRISAGEQADLTAQEVWALAQVRARGVPAPEVLVADTTLRDIPAPYLIMRRLPGEPAASASLTASGRAAVLEQLGHHLAAIHSIALAGFGSLAAHGETYIGRAPSLWAYVQEEGERRLTKLSAATLPRQQAEAIRGRLAHARASLALDRAVLIHGDYQLKNVLVQGTRVTGIVDFENLVAGDPVMDFCALHYWSRQPTVALQHLQRGYGQPALFGQDFLRRLYLYELLLALEILWWEEHFQDRAGIQEALTQLSDIITALDALLAS